MRRGRMSLTGITGTRSDTMKLLLEAQIKEGTSATQWKVSAL